MLTARSGPHTAVVVAHEIFGPNAHTARVAERFRQHNCAVFTPNFLPGNRIYQADQAKLAHEAFTRSLGVRKMSEALQRFTATLRDTYERVVCVGFSVGATAAWLISASGTVDAVVCVYGSRIREHTTVAPGCPSLLIFATDEASFYPRELADQLKGTDNVTVDLYECQHGFCDEDNPNYAAAESERAMQSAVEFLKL